MSWKGRGGASLLVDASVEKAVDMVKRRPSASRSRSLTGVSSGDGGFLKQLHLS